MLEAGNMDSAEAEMATTALKNSDNFQPPSLDERIKALLLPFQCSFCDETFRGHLRLLRHMIRAHENAKFQIQCGICLTVYFKPQYHAFHLFNKHLDGASPDLIEKLKTEFGFYEKFKRKPEIGKYQRKKEKLKLLRKENDDTPTPKRKPPPKSKDPKPKRKGPKNQDSFDCFCGQKLKSQEHLEAHKSSHNIRIDPTIKCHLCAGAFDCVDDWLLHNCQRDLNSNLEQDLHVEPEVIEVLSRSPSPELADLPAASTPQHYNAPVASPGSPPQNFDSPVASPASPPQNFDSLAASPGSPSPECHPSAPAPASPPRPSDSFKALLQTFQKIIEDLPPPNPQTDLVLSKDSRPLDEPVHVDEDVELGSPAEPLTSSPQNSEGQGCLNDLEVPTKPTATAEESQRVSDLCGQSPESQKEILVVDLASSPPALAQQQDCQPPEATNNAKKSKRDPTKPTRKQRKRKQPPPEDLEDLEVYNYLCKFNLQPFYICNRCPARYKFKLHLVEHKHKYCQGNSASSEYNGCRMCGQEFSSKQELEAHITSRHKESKPGSWACDLCDNVYDWERALKFHKDSTHKIREKPVHICRLCSKPCQSVKEIVKHYQTEHPKICYSVCTSCGEQFKDRYERREHERKKHYSRNSGPNVVCEICGKEMTKRALQVHMERVHAEKNFLCTNCGASFGSLALLHSHEFIHLPKEDRPFRCKFCSYGAAQNLSLEQHMARRHLDHDGFVEYDIGDKEKPFVCDQCGKTYTSEIALEEHKIFHGERTYKCRKCNELMFTRYHLVAHQQEFHLVRHTSFKEPRTCPYCAKTFTRKPKWYTHQRTCAPDSNPRSDATKCAECGKVYGSKADLTYHIRSAHLKTVAYHCEVCGKGSNSKSNLKAHMKLHGGGYECDVCKCRFLNFPALSKHTFDEHGRDPIRMYRKTQGKLKRIVESLKESSEAPQEEHVYDAAK